MTKANMLDCQLQPMSLPDFVLSAINAAPWNICVSPGYEHLAFSDLGMPITDIRQSLSPIAMAMALAALQPKAQDSVLEIGSSVMRLSSIFSNICCSVFVVESDQNRYLADCQLLEELDLRNVSLTLGLELPNDQFEIIMVNTEVGSNLITYKSMLQANGRLCYVQDNTLMLYTKADGVTKQIFTIKVGPAPKPGFEL